MLTNRTISSVSVEVVELEEEDRESEVSIRATQICSRGVGGVRSVPKDFTIWFAIASTSSEGESVRRSRRRWMRARKGERGASVNVVFRLAVRKASYNTMETEVS